MQKNQELDGVDYSQVDPKQHPAFKPTQSTDSIKQPEWLNQDSIDSL